MKKILVVGVILLFLGSSIPALAQPKEYARPLSHTLYVGGTGPGNYSKIQDAVDNASDNDTVFVFSGIYREFVGIDYHPIHLIGENPITTIIDDSGFSTYDEAVYIGSDNTSFTGFTVKYVKDIHRNPRGILIDGNSVNVYGNIITGNSIGIQSGEGGFGVKIYRNIISNNSVGCVLHFAYLNRIYENNFIHNSGQALYVNSWVNHWYRNYWDNAVNKGVKIIFGIYRPVIPPIPLLVPLFNLDLHPAQKPYNILSLNEGGFQ